MTTYGVTSAGFVRKPLSQAINDFLSRVAAGIGIAIDTSPEGPFGQMALQFMNEIAGEVTTDPITGDVVSAGLWQLAEQIYNSWDPAKASGVQLDVICSFTKTTRKGPTLSIFPLDTSPLVLAGIDGTVVPDNSIVRNNTADVQYRTTLIGTLAAPTVWSASAAVTLLDVVRTAGGQIYVALSDGTTGGTAPTGTGAYPATYLDGTVTWAFVATATGAVTVPGEALAAGATPGKAFTINSIGTPVSGWQAVLNPQDVLIGSNGEPYTPEGDNLLRLRRVAELSIGLSTLGAIRKAVLQLAAVTSARAFQNTSDIVDADGRAPHSVEIMLTGSPTDFDVGNALFAATGGGIATDGSHTNNVTAEDGNVWPMHWTTPTPVNVYAQTTIYVNPEVFPSNGKVDIEALMLAFGNALLTGADVRPGGWELYLGGKNAFPEGALLEAVTFFDTAPITVDPLTPFGGSDLEIGPRAIAVFDSTRIAVFIVGQVP